MSSASLRSTCVCVLPMQALVKKQELGETPPAKKTRSDSSSNLLKAGVSAPIKNARHVELNMHEKLTVCPTCL